jgi:hypothetical protein
MAQDNEYVEKLIAARDREVAHRRDVAKLLAGKSIAVTRKTRESISSKSRKRLKPSSVPFGMRDISPTQSPSRSRLSASEADSKDRPRGRKAVNAARQTSPSCRSFCEGP